MATKVISDWSVERCGRQQFTAPEALDHLHLGGIVAGRNGRVLTTRIIFADGRLVTTRSGTVYRLGRPSPAFMRWLREKGIKYDPETPVKVPAPIPAVES
jgi:hypothetical protein